MKPLVLGIITRNEVVRTAISDLEGNVLGTGAGVRDEACHDGFESSVGEAMVRAGLRRIDAQAGFGAIVVGMDGVSNGGASVPEWVQRHASPGRLMVAHVLRMAQVGALGGRHGIVLEISEGSSCYGMNEQGEEWMAGGWGHLVWDEGSSFWLGMEGIRAATNGTSELLRTGALTMLHLDDPDALLYRLYLGEISRSEAIAMAPVVCRAAEAGDTAAIDILRRGAGELAENVLSVARHLAMPSPEIAAIGSMVAAGNIFLRPLTEELHLRVRGCRVIEPVLSPLLGACLLGVMQIQGSVPARVVERLAIAGS